jgi:hypothetical protein
MLLYSFFFMIKMNMEKIVFARKGGLGAVF